MAKLTQEQYNRLLKEGLNHSQIETIAKQKGYSLPQQKSTVGGLASGFAKGFVGDVARPTAQLLQGLGQRTLAAVTPSSLQDVQKQTGFKSLDDKTAEGQAVVESLRTKGVAETTGRVAANIASFFIPVSPAAQVAGRTLTSAGRITARAGIGVSAKEAPLIQAYKARVPVSSRILTALKGGETTRPITNAETALRHSLWGSESMLGIQAKRASDNIWKQIIQPALKNNPTKIQMSGFIDDIAKQIDSVTDLSRKKELTRALNAFKDDFGPVGKINLEQLQKYKEGWAKFLPDKVYKGKPIAGSFREIQNIAATNARNIIYKELKNIEGKVAYLDYGNLTNLQKLGQKAMTGSKLKGGAGSFVSGIYNMVVTPIATTGGLTLYRTGQGLEFVGRQGVKILGHLLR